MAQTRVEEHRRINHNIRCTVEVQDREWIPAAPAIVSGKIENLSEGPLEIQVQPILYLSSKTSTAERDKYWAPVDLLRDGPLLVDKRPTDQKGDVIAIKPVPIKLTFSKRNESIDFRIDARHVLWEREISSIWPSRDLFAAVYPGSYDLRLVLETESGDSASANVAVLVRSTASHEQKTGDVAILRFSFAFLGVDERYRDVSPVTTDMLAFSVNWRDNLGDEGS